MNWKLIKKLTSLFFLLSLVAACSPATNNNGNTTVTGTCANEYYPVLQGATWTYESTGGPAGDYRFTDTISAAKNGSFTLTSQYGDLTYIQDWNCLEEGLSSRQPAGSIAAILRTQDLTFPFEVKQVDGVTLPPALTIGDEWQHSITFDGKMEIANAPATAEGTAHTNYKVLDTDSISVPAGSFETIRIQVGINLDVTIKVQGISVPASFSGTYTYWYARGIGLVKAEGQGSIASASFSETIELQSYNIP